MAAPTDAAWLVARFLPCTLFALKVSSATSSVGRTLLVPTPYAIKMALVEAAFTAGLSQSDCAALLRALIPVPVRIGPPARAVVSHTFLKIRQEPKTPDPAHRYISSVAYREVVYHQGEWRWAFGVGDQPPELAARLVLLLPYVRSIGRRGSFVQFVGIEWRDELDAGFTQPAEHGALRMPLRGHIVPLDDLGPEADLATLSPYSPSRAVAGRHRVFVNTVVPLGVANAGPGFTEYRSD
jgi:hypothetical protein